MDIPGIRKSLVYSLFFIVLPVLLAGAIYLLFRSSNTVVYSLFDRILSTEKLDLVRESIIKQPVKLPIWFIYSLPGGLWVFAFSNACFLLLYQKARKHQIRLVIMLFSIVTSLEILQLFNVTDGIFDITDLALYLLGAIASSSLNIFRMKKFDPKSIIKNEKKPYYAVGLTVCLFCATIYLADVAI